MKRITLALLVAGIVLAAPAHAYETKRQEPACVDDAPHVCQPGNAEGKPAGCYDIGGVLVADWPCEPWHPAKAPEKPYEGRP
ncbi:MAG TPA: hypothetical protein VKG83_01660 [Mycobacterium sp.]|nr:hypothetical protein [Mycobacterium sp.]